VYAQLCESRYVAPSMDRKFRVVTRVEFGESSAGRWTQFLSNGLVCIHNSR
jgi:hypothetical protein